MNILFVLEGDPNHRTGGHIYNQKVSEGLREIGHTVNFCVFSAQEMLSEEIALVKSFNPSIIILDSLGGSRRMALISAFRESEPLVKFIFLNHLPAASLGIENNEEALVMKKSDLTVVTGRWAHDLLMDKFEIGSQIIEPGVHTIQWKKRPSNFAGTIFMCGSIEPRKGYMDVLNALGRLRTLNWRLEIAGRMADMGYLLELEEQCVNLDIVEKVDFLGELSEREVEESLKRCDIFISASRVETYGMSADEAVFSGIPSILSRIPAYTFRFNDYPVEWFEAEDSDSLAQVLGRFLLSGKHYLSWCKAIKQNAFKRRSWYDVTQDWKKIVNELN